MIHAVFERKNGRLCGVQVNGHAGYAEEGQDIVCAAVSSAVQLTANLITDTFREKAKVRAAENVITVQLRQNTGNGAALLNGLYVHLQYLSEDYPRTIETEITEV
ncbi:MAG: ribosomal-processing cysteine protease Prp [Oscillospiraceae bacterium]|nr:ribosomal-processing cysteine protease Prp [Oscillospiraceae bacterium]